MPKIAMCHGCKNEPLVSTFAFYKKEFICLSCGTRYEWLEPAATEETPKLVEVMEARAKEWNENAGDILIFGAKHTDCEKCNTTDDYSHTDHATDEEKAAHLKSCQWVNQRTGVQVYNLETVGNATI